MNIEENLAVSIGGGFFVGILIGYALKKVAKIVAIVIGLFFAGLAYLQYQQIVNIDWDKLQPVSQNEAIAVLNSTKYIPGLTTGSGHATNFTLSDLGIPLTGSIAIGFTLGFVRGWGNETGREFVNKSRIARGKWRDMMFMNLFRRKKEDIYEILLPGERSQQAQPFTSAKPTVEQQVSREQRTDEQIINVIGRDEELDFLDHLFLSNEDLNILYNGSPAAAKTMILKGIQQKFPDQCYFFDFSLTTGKGFIQLLINKRREEKSIPNRMLGKKPKQTILLINEIDKIKPLSDLNLLLDLLDGKEINKVVYNKEYHVKFDNGLRIFATSNNAEKLTEAIRSRFLIRELADYTFEQFVQIGKALGEKYLKVKDDRAREQIAEEFSRGLFAHGIRDVRRLIDIFKIFNIYRGEKSPNEIINMHT